MRILKQEGMNLNGTTNDGDDVGAGLVGSPPCEICDAGINPAGRDKPCPYIGLISHGLI